MTSKLALARIERGRAIQGAKDMRRTNRDLVKRVKELVDAGAQAAIERDVLLKALSDVLLVIDEVGVATGVCCCGDDMKRHDNPMDCGHSPVDEGEYHFAPVVEAAKAIRDRASAS